MYCVVNIDIAFLFEPHIDIAYDYGDRIYTFYRHCTTHSCNKHNTISSSNSYMEEEPHHHHHQQPSCLLLTITAILFKLLECHTNIIIIFLNHITLNNIIINGLLLLSSFTHPILLLHLHSKDHYLLSLVRTYLLLLFTNPAFEIKDDLKSDMKYK